MADTSELPPLLETPLHGIEAPLPSDPTESAPKKPATPPLPSQQAPTEEFGSSKPLNKVSLTPSEFGSGVGKLFSGLFLLFLIVSSNFVGELFSCDLQNMLRTTRSLKHLFGFAMLFYFVNLTSSTLPWSKGLLAGFSAALYALFVLSSRTTADVQMVTFMFLFAIFIVQMVKADQIAKLQTEPSQEKQKEIQDRYQRINLVTYVLSIIVVAIVIIGHIMFAIRSTKTYAELWSISTCDDGKQKLPNSAVAQPVLDAQSDQTGVLGRNNYDAEALSWFDNGSDMTNSS